MVVEGIPAGATHPLRRLVLRDGDRRADVAYPEDERPGSFHLGVWEASELIAVASFSPEATPLRPGRRSARLRGMAVRPDRQGHGVGRLLLADGLSRLRAEGYETVWANGRDSALGFYSHLGWIVEGDSFDLTIAGRPIAHHRVVVDFD